MQISKSKSYQNNQIEIEVYDLTYEQRFDYLQLGNTFQFLETGGDIIVLDITSEGKQTQILLTPDRVVPCIDLVTENLIEKQAFEICSLLRDVKLEYISQNDD